MTYAHLRLSSLVTPTKNIKEYQGPSVKFELNTHWNAQSLTYTIVTALLTLTTAAFTYTDRYGQLPLIGRIWSLVTMVCYFTSLKRYVHQRT